MLRINLRTKKIKNRINANKVSIGELGKIGINSNLFKKEQDAESCSFFLFFSSILRNRFISG